MQLSAGEVPDNVVMIIFSKCTSGYRQFEIFPKFSSSSDKQKQKIELKHFRIVNVVD